MRAATAGTRRAGPREVAERDHAALARVGRSIVATIHERLNQSRLMTRRQLLVDIALVVLPEFRLVVHAIFLGNLRVRGTQVRIVVGSTAVCR